MDLGAEPENAELEVVLRLGPGCCLPKATFVHSWLAMEISDDGPMKKVQTNGKFREEMTRDR
jgi:hypothetical protein